MTNFIKNVGLFKYKYSYPGANWGRGAAQQGVGDSVGTLNRRVRLFVSLLLCRRVNLSSAWPEASASPRREDDLSGLDIAYLCLIT